MLTLILNRSHLSRTMLASIFGALILVSLISYAGVFRDNKSDAVRVERGNVTSSVITSGPVQPDNRIDVKPPIPGRAEKVLVVIGQHVEKGQTLLWMSSGERTAVLDAAGMTSKDEFSHWEKSLPATPVVSPVTGVVIQRNIEPGQGFSQSDAIIVIADRLIVETPLDETDLALVKVGQKASITLDAYQNDVMSGSVSSVAFDSREVANVTSYMLRVAFDGTPDFVRVGMTANIKIDMESRHDVLVIPTSALKADEDRLFVQIPKMFGAEPEKRWIKTGLNDGKRVEILEGLKEHESVIVHSKSSRKNSGQSFGAVSM